MTAAKKIIFSRWDEGKEWGWSLTIQDMGTLVCDHYKRTERAATAECLNAAVILNLTLEDSDLVDKRITYPDRTIG